MSIVNDKWKECMRSCVYVSECVSVWKDHKCIEVRKKVIINNDNKLIVNKQWTKIKINNKKQQQQQQQQKQQT